jgi:60 kDa SS-A/Ro ribonucleoprotein
MKTQNKSRLASHVNPANIPQTQPLDNRMIKNSAGGYTYAVSCWDQLSRFVLLGTYGGTYYVNEQKLTKTNVDALVECMTEDPKKYAATVAQISLDGRAAKNDFAVFALALACAKNINGSRKEALSVLNDVCRIGTHLFQFLEDYKGLGGGFGRSIRTAVSNWYTSKSIDSLANQLIKYRNRNSWTHKDAFRVCHVRNDEKNHIIRYVVKGWEGGVEYPAAINAFEMLKTADSARAVEIINSYNVTREFVPTNLLNDKNVMNALAMKMPISAMIRNLGNMTRVLDWQPSEPCKALDRTLDNLENPELISKGRVHPMFVLTALRQYEQGGGISSSWKVHPKIVSGLNDAFKFSVKSADKLGTKILQAVDVSGSMYCPAGTNFSCLEAAGSMALVNSLVEPYVHNIAFSDKIDNANVVLHDRMSVSEAARAFGNGGGTDLALPITWALSNNKSFDLIIVYTDNETYLGRRHMADLWKEYRKTINPNAKLVIASTAANQYTVGDPNDNSVLQCVGFDANLLTVIQNWARI